MTFFRSSSSVRSTATIVESSALDHTTAVVTPGWTRRNWLTVTTSALAAVLPARRAKVLGTRRKTWAPADLQARAAAHAELLDLGPAQAIVQQAVDVARSAGAQYADAKLTRIVQHHYGFGSDYGYGSDLSAQGDVRLEGNTHERRSLTFYAGRIVADIETVGFGVRALYNGAWGFSAFPLWAGANVDATLIARLARDAVDQAKINARSSPPPVEMGTMPVVKGTWTTPVKIDPFTIPIEEKSDAISLFWMYAGEAGLSIDPAHSFLHFARQERIVATSDGSLLTQTCYESGSSIECYVGNSDSGKVFVPDIDTSAQGWERLTEGHIPEKMKAIREELEHMGSSRPATVGRYTVVCDGATMAAMLAETIGVATQLDRALGYEANAGGTSFLDDPLTMLGQYQVSVPGVTVTANRSASAQLATVKWDDEGVEPSVTTLVKDGVVTDFQSTREQAAWLAPYYQQHGRPVRSNGYASSEDGLHTTMQLMPNLALEPNTENVGIADLIANIKSGILIEGGSVESIDFQARNGLLGGGKQSLIRNGKIVTSLSTGTIGFNTTNFWKNVTQVGGMPTLATVPFSQYGDWWKTYLYDGAIRGLFPESNGAVKGQPKQRMGYSVRAAAAVIANQPIIVPRRTGA